MLQASHTSGPYLVVIKTKEQQQQQAALPEMIRRAETAQPHSPSSFSSPTRQRRERERADDHGVRSLHFVDDGGDSARAS